MLRTGFFLKTKQHISEKHYSKKCSVELHSLYESVCPYCHCVSCKMLPSFVIK